jgi:hypothetical protein
MSVSVSVSDVPMSVYVSVSKSVCVLSSERRKRQCISEASLKPHPHCGRYNSQTYGRSCNEREGQRGLQGEIRLR